MSTNLKDQTCVVTGSAGSIGLSIAERLVESGAKVAMLDLNEAVESEAERIAADGASCIGITVDVTDREAVFTAFAQIESQFGPVYALVNNAGIVDQRPFDEITPDIYRKVMDVNVAGTLYCIQAAARSMRSLSGGKIVNFSSKSGKTGSALMAHYSAAKGAIIALTHAVAFELAGFNINVNCLCPGIIEDTGVWDSVSNGYVTNLGLSQEEVVAQFVSKVPLKRLATKADIVEFVYFLVTAGEYCTGQAFNISGGREVH